MATTITMMRLQKRLGYTFKNPALLQQALTHRSANAVHNKRLELLGDAVLNLVIIRELYHRFPDAAEGHLTQMQAILVCGQTLAELAQSLFVEGDLVLGKGVLKGPGFQRDAIEAIIGAIYLDSQHIAVIEKLIIDWYHVRLDRIQPGNKLKDPKSRLQEYLQAIYRERPVYTLVGTQGRAHKQKFVVQCQVIAAQQVAFIGQGSSKRRAEQAAAKQAIAYLKIETKE